MTREEIEAKAKERGEISRRMCGGNKFAGECAFHHAKEDFIAGAQWALQQSEQRQLHPIEFLDEFMLMKTEPPKDRFKEQRPSDEEIERINKYARHQFNRGALGLELVSFEDWAAFPKVIKNKL